MEPGEAETMQQYQDIDTNFEFLSRYALSPEIEGFAHLDKNLVITNLNARLHEPERLREILNALHVLLRYMVKEERIVQSDEFEVMQQLGEDGKPLFDKENKPVLVKIPLFEKKVFDVPRYPRATRYFMQMFYSFVTTSAARGGYLLRNLMTKTLKQEQTIEDRTNVKKPWGLQKWKNNNKSGVSDYYG